MPKTTQTDSGLDIISKHLAREIFKEGDDMHGPCIRITFRIGGHAKVVSEGNSKNPN
jgi:hypothetical protein